MQVFKNNKNSSRTLFITKSGIVLGLLTLNFITVAADHDDRAGLYLDAERQLYAGLQTTTLAPFQYIPEFSASGVALTLQPLFDLRNRYNNARAQYQSARAHLLLTRQNSDRARHLYRSGTVSQRTVQEQQAQWQQDKAQVQALQLQVEALYNEAVLNWGQVLAQLFLADDAAPLSPYLSGQKALLQIALPAGETLTDGIEHIAVSATGNRREQHPAQFMAKAPQTDALTQGESYFFSADHAAIKAGMRLSAWIPRQQQKTTGVLIPGSALVWHLGQAFVYRQTGEDLFIRRPVTHFIQTHGGYFIQDGLAPGDRLVTTGAQMLLSEEFRGQIPDEDDD